MGKTLYTLNIGNYAPELCALTYPLLKKYAERCRAEFFVIKERKFPGYPIPFEKLQIFNLARERGDEWSIYLDSDTLVHPETIDFTCFLPKDTIMHNGVDPAPLRFRYDHVFMRDGRNIGSCNWCSMASDWCRDLWHPLDIPLEEALSNIRPTQGELRSGVIDPSHLLDDYTLSRNVARFGLKVNTAPDVYKKLNLAEPWFFWHIYDVTIDEKLKQMSEVIEKWRLAP